MFTDKLLKRSAEAVSKAAKPLGRDFVFLSSRISYFERGSKHVFGTVEHIGMEVGSLAMYVIRVVMEHVPVPIGEAA